MDRRTFSDRISPMPSDLSAGEARVVGWIAGNRETALHASAVEIARAAGASDATVIRAARRLGYAGLSPLREALAADLRRDVSLADRLAGELEQADRVGPLSAATATLRVALDAVETLPAADIDRTVNAMLAARRVQVFGIGPTGFIAGYFVTQLARLGIDARALTRTGRQFADDLVGVGPGDMVVALAYDHAGSEVRALFDRAVALDLGSVLVTSDAPRLPDARAGATLRVPRGRTGGFGFHAGTLALLESLLLALSAADPGRASKALDALETARRAVSGRN